MSVEWFYTSEKRQMGPVSWEELRELAEVGILKPHDMVWSNGMDEWVKAINQQGLFADDDGVPSAGKKKASYKATKPPPGRRTGRKEDEEDEEEETDSREAKRAARKKQEERAKMAIGLKVGLILGGVVAALVLLGCVGIGLIWMTIGFGGGGGGGGGGAPIQPYTVVNLPEKKFDERRFTLTQGRRVVITCTNNLQFANTDVDVLVFRGNNQQGPNERPIAGDERLPNVDRNCRVEFVVPATDTYRIRVVNLGPGVCNSSVVNIQER